VALAHALLDEGHEVALYSGEKARLLAHQLDISFFPFGAELDKQMMSFLLPENGRSDISSVAVDRRWVYRISRLNEALKGWLIETIPGQIADLTAILSSFQPDILVTDPTLMGPILILKETQSVPIAVFSFLAGCSVPGPEAPPWGRGLPPPRNFVSQLRCTAEKKIVWWLTGDVRRRMNEIRRMYQLPPLSQGMAQEYSKVDLFMVTSTPSFDYNRTDLPACVHYVGACSWDSSGKEDLPEWLEALDSSRPLVHVTEGTIHTSEPLLLKAAAAGLSGLDCHVVMTTGKHRRPEELNLGSFGPNIRIEQFVPHSHLFPRTDLVITTGGAGTVTKALISGVPLIVVPTAWELPENAQRVVECGAGLRIEPRRCSPARLRAAVEKVLGDPSYRENAARIGHDLLKEGGPSRAVELLEKLVTERSESRS